MSRFTRGISVGIGALGLAGCTTMGASDTSPEPPLAAMAGDPIDIAGFSSEDETFAQPYIDVDEWRTAPVRHRYVHGGFKDTDTRFSYYFPPADQYDGRFFQHVTPVPDNENLAQKVPAGENSKIGSSADSGAYFVETNGGGQIDLVAGSNALPDPTITAYRANAAAAQFSRHVAAQVYGTQERPYGYIYGGSGGAFRTIGSVENTDGVWDGAVPYVPGSTMAIPNMFTVRMQALRVLRDKFPQIADATEPGGSGDPYAGLTKHEASVLREIEQMGFPMESWFGYRAMGLHGFAALYGGVAAADPTYFSDFWTKPGYLGHDRPELFAADRVKFAGTIAEPITALEAHKLGLSADPFAKAQRGNVDTAFKGSADEAERIVGFRLNEKLPPAYFLGGELIVSSGAAGGQRLALSTIEDDAVMLGVTQPSVVSQVAAGDAVTVDNSNFLAMETYHRHQVPGPDFTVWDQFRNAQGKPLYPQRPMIIGPLFVQSTSGSVMHGKVDEKVIIAASLWDREAMPWQADWYRQRVAAYHDGNDADNIRLYFTNHALHGDALPEQMAESPARIVSYVPTLQQALRDVAAWAENGIAPPPSTQYRIEAGQVVIPPSAEVRLGIQPTVQLTVNGAERADVSVGQPVAFKGIIAVPPGTGSLVSVQWDFEGEGTYPVSSPVPDGAKTLTVEMTHSFDTPGTYFPALKGVSHRAGDKQSPYARIRDLGRVRVVVK